MPKFTKCKKWLEEHGATNIKVDEEQWDVSGTIGDCVFNGGAHTGNCPLSETPHGHCYAVYKNGSKYRGSMCVSGQRGIVENWENCYKRLFDKAGD
jgi:hypothetical protein